MKASVSTPSTPEIPEAAIPRLSGQSVGSDWPLASGSAPALTASADSRRAADLAMLRRSAAELGAAWDLLDADALSLEDDEDEEEVVHVLPGEDEDGPLAVACPRGEGGAR